MRKWIAYWNIEGFECLEEITRYEHWERDQLLEILSDRPPQPNPLSRMITGMSLRARLNTQRQYELYVFSSDPDIEPESLKSWAERDPQSLVVWIRKNGIKIHSDRNPSRKRVIT